MAYMTTSMYGPYTPPCKCRVHGGHVHGRVYGPCTRLLTSVHAGPGTRPYISEHRHVRGRVPCTRSTLQHVYTAVLYTAVLYTAVLYTAVNVPGTRPCTAMHPVHGRVYVYANEHGTVYGPYARPCTHRVHGRSLAVYMVRL